jgi:hypothetical protein
MSDMQGSAPAGNPAADAAGQQSGGSQGQWFDSFPEEIKGVAQLKGWQSPVDAIQSYSNLEKLMGADKAGRGVVLPKDDAPAEEWGKLYDKLGRPKSPDEYKLPIPDGDTGEFAKVAASKFHELGITAKQAESLAEWWNANSQQMQQGQLAAIAQNSEAEMQALQGEWGKEFDANIESARRATRQFGVEAQTLEKIENAIGTKEMLKLFSSIGKGLGEDSYVDGGKSGGFGMSPEAARVRIGQLKADSEWSSKYLSGNADAKAELERLMKSAYPS